MAKTTLEETYATTLATVLADNPSTTVAQLRELVDEYPQLGGVTLSQVLGGGTARKAAKPKASAPAPVKPSKPGASKAKAGWNVRTEPGRAALQVAVVEALRACGGQNVSASDMRSLGATPQQLRTTLNRLIEDGAVTYTGQARGTRYSLV